MPKKKIPKSNDKEQSTRFIEAAEKVQSENAQEAFEKAMEKIAKKKREPST